MSIWQSIGRGLGFGVQNAVPAPLIVRGSNLFNDLTGGMGQVPAPSEQTAMTVSAIHAC